MDFCYHTKPYHEGELTVMFCGGRRDEYMHRMDSTLNPRHKFVVGPPEWLKNLVEPPPPGEKMRPEWIPRPPDIDVLGEELVRLGQAWCPYIWTPGHDTDPYYAKVRAQKRLRRAAKKVGLVVRTESGWTRGRDGVTAIVLSQDEED